MAAWLKDAAAGEGALVSFRLGATLSAHGTVSRGVCEVQDGALREVTERTKLRAQEDGVLDLDAPEAPLLDLETPVSMNFWGFHPSVLPHFEAGFIGFLGSLPDPLKSEYYLPSAVKRGLNEGWLKVRALAGGQRWFGVTYPQDKAEVQSALRTLVAEGSYPSKL